MTGMFRARPGSIARTAAMAVAALAASAVLAHAEAPVRNTKTFGPVNGVTVTFSVPATYDDCTPTGLTDALTTTGIPANWRLLGQVNIGYIGPDAAFHVTQVVQVDQLGNLNLQIAYPPHSAIELNHVGIIEYHVEPQIEVYDENGFKVSWIGGDIVNAPGTLGPGGQDWDVYCLNPPPPPPPPPPPTLAGCTPGYWKQTQHFDSYVGTGVAPGTSFNSIFVGYPLADTVWYFALDGGGGPGLEGALKNLRRAAAAAYLNAAKLDYGYSPAQVVAAVQTAVATGDRSTILALASALDVMNNRGCPLN
jgi:hypothetical protein